ncbi:type IV secretory system conjugative DNA transfer family protein [Georgenia wangjunii]|uniref:type IV secretory system conjugative DNA transfer family protein n=1 Tax=Georgenia wangjunii TaxID=3117730 RepID=UPI002F263B0D
MVTVPSSGCARPAARRRWLVDVSHAVRGTPPLGSMVSAGSSPRSAPTGLHEDLTTCSLVGLSAAGALAGVLWAGAWVAAVATGRVPPRLGIGGAAALLANPADPAAAWGTPMPGAVTYWALTSVVLMATATVIVIVARWWRRSKRRGEADPRSLAGIATAAEVTAAAGLRAVRRRARHARPSLHRPVGVEVGYRLGRSRGVETWASVEDSMLVVGPPRSGKGLHLVIPMLLDAPGAVVATSTRPDNLAVTLQARRAVGPVAVFDPQRLAPGVAGGLRWSPVRGCELPQTAMIRARALAAGTGMSRTVEGGDFWQGQTEAVLRSLLHAAVLGGRSARDLYRWSLDPATVADAVTILAQNGAAPGWDDALEQAAHSDPRTRDSIWLGVRQALSSLADPRVLEAVSPRPGEEFDPTSFLHERGTLFVLGTASGAGAAGSLVAALVEDMVETARSLAATSPGGRLDPPLLLALDEIGNLAPLPSLPSLMSEGGGSGITTLAVLQSLSQARDRWGEQPAGALWDAAIAKVILGGGSNARDLADLSALIGDRDEFTDAVSRGAYGERSTSTSVRRVPVMDTSRLRTLPFGTGVLLLRTAPPIVLDLAPWTSRKDARALSAARGSVEAQLRTAADSKAATDCAAGGGTPGGETKDEVRAKPAQDSGSCRATGDY